MLMTYLFLLVFIAHPVIINLYIKTKRKKCTELLEKPVTKQTINKRFLIDGDDTADIATTIFYFLPAVILVVLVAFHCYTTMPLEKVGIVIIASAFLGSLIIATIAALTEMHFSELNKLYRKYTTKVESLYGEEKELSDTETTTEFADPFHEWLRDITK